MDDALPDARTDLFSGRRFFILLAAGYLFAVALFGGLMLRELRQIDDHVQSVARERGAALFSLIELARDWNALHGGVYVPVTDYTQPNPYLNHPRRDMKTVDGLALTMVNPAFMTRQIAEIAARKEGVQMHITSLNPIRPANRPDAWEADALKSFNAGAREHLELVAEAGEQVFRYMAPLMVKEPCLACHSVQGYTLGEIRGGISVSMPARDLLAIRDAQRGGVIWRYAGVTLLVVTLWHLMLTGGRRFVHAIQRINREQETTIAERTGALAAANTDLAREVDQRRLQQREAEASEARYRAVVENATDGVFVADAVAVLFANQRLAMMLGRPIDQIVGSDPVDFVHPADRERMAQWRRSRVGQRGTAGPERIRLVHGKSERVVHADVFLTMIEGIDDDNPRALVTVRDVSAELEAEREAQIAAAVFESAAEAIMVTDREATILRVNPAFTAITGFTPRDVEGRTPRMLKSGRHDQAFYAEMWRVLLDTGRWQGEIWNRRKNGETYIEWLSITRIEGGEDHGGFVATFTDITKRKEAEELMAHKAHYDALTDLPNRALFRDRLHSALALARRHERQCGLLYIDLDRFKEVNDTLGHAAGDALLVEAAHRLTTIVRDSDTIARLGGDEFAVVLSELNGQMEAEDVAQRIVEAMVRPFELNEGTARVSASIGIALFPEHGEDAGALQKHADMALYAVKEGGRNGYRVYSPLMAR